MPSLDELDTVPVGRPTAEVEVCLDGDLVVRMSDLAEEIDALVMMELSRPRKGADSGNPRIEQARAELVEVREAAAAQTGKLRVCAAITQGEWSTFVDTNPPRPEGSTGRDRDDRWAHGKVNVDALRDRLHEFADAWDGKQFTPGQFTRVIEPRLVGGDIGEATRAVVELYEGRRDFHQMQAISSVYLRQSPGSSSPATAG